MVVRTLSGLLLCRWRVSASGLLVLGLTGLARVTLNMDMGKNSIWCRLPLLLARLLLMALCMLWLLKTWTLCLFPWIRWLSPRYAWQLVMRAVLGPRVRTSNRPPTSQWRNVRVNARNWA